MERRALIRKGLVALPLAAAGIGSGAIVLNNMTLSQAALAWPHYKSGGSGEDVYTIQYLLRQRGQNITADGLFGPKTTTATKNFQTAQKLGVDGVVGPLTWEKLILSIKEGSKGNVVNGLQRQLNYHGSGLAVDGDFGPKTATAVKSFQTKYKLTANGIVDLASWNKLVTVAPPAAPLRDINSFGSSIEGYASYVAQTQCSGIKPGVSAFRDMFLRAFSGTTDLGIVRGCSSGGTSEHKEGRAWDWGIRVGNAKADQALNWLLATDKYGHKHAMVRRTGIMYIIWNRRIWSAHRASEGWRSYTGSNPHTDHVHFSFGWNGANKKTSFWTS